jgi:hypothetical protein
MQHLNAIDIDEHETNIRSFVKAANALLLLCSCFAGFIFMMEHGSYLSMVLGTYITLFSGLLLMLEIKRMPEGALHVIRRDAGFLLHPKGRGTFVVALALVLFGFDSLGTWIAVFIVFTVFANAFTMIKFPTFKDEQFAVAHDSMGLTSSGADEFGAGVRPGGVASPGGAGGLGGDGDLYSGLGSSGFAHDISSGAPNAADL